MTLEALAIVLFFAIIFVLLLAYLSGYIPLLKQAGQRSLCKESVAIHAGKPLELFRGSIRCPPEHIVISGSLTSPKTQQKAKETLARALTSCFQDFGEGKLDLFTQNGVYCNVCSFIDFTDTSGKLTGVTLYLGNTTVPYKDISFLDYFAGYTTPHFRQYVNNPALFNAHEAAAAPDIPDTSKRYATIFMYARGEDAVSRTLDSLTSTIGVSQSGGRFIGVGATGIIAGTLGATAGILMLGPGLVGFTVASLAAITIGGGTVYGLTSFTDKPQWMAFPRIVPYEPDALSKLGCERLEVKMR